MTREQSREVSVERKFTEDELQDMAEEMTTLVLDKERHEDEKSAYNKEKNEIIKDLDSQITDIAHQYDRGAYDEVVTATLHVDMDGGKRLWVDPDTGEVLKSEPLEPEDYQLDIESEIEVSESGAPVDGVQPPPFKLNQNHLAVLRDARDINSTSSVVSYEGQPKQFQMAADTLIAMEYVDGDNYKLVRGITKKGQELFEAGYAS